MIFPSDANLHDYIRQGDIYITKIEGVEKRFVEVELKELFNNHVLDSSPKIFKLRGFYIFTLLVTEPVTIHHPEHEAVTLHSGIYKVHKQRSFRPVVD